MNLEDVAAYFKKKIAKAIPFGIETVNGPNRYATRHYIIEPTAVTKKDGVWLEALVIYDHFILDRRTRREVGLTAEVSIPMKAGDTVQDVMDMAIASADFGPTHFTIPTLASELYADRIEIAEKKLDKRLTEHLGEEDDDDLDGSGPKP